MPTQQQHQQQRPFFLSHFFSSFRPQPTSLRSQSRSASAPTTTNTTSSSTAPSTSTSTSTTTSTGYHARSSYGSSTFSTVAAAAAAQRAAAAASGASSSTSSSQQQQQQQQQSRSIPINMPSSRRRGSNSSSEGFRETMGADRYYIGGRTAAGEEKYFKLGVVRRVKSNDGLSLDRLSL